MFRHILLATDLTAASEGAQAHAAALAARFRADLTVVHVCETPALAAAAAGVADGDLVGPCGDDAEARLGRIAWRLRGDGLRADAVLRRGVAWEEIVAVAREVGADLVVTGTHGRHGIAHAFYGSVAEKVVQESPVPVLAVPQPRG